MVELRRYLSDHPPTTADTFDGMLRSIYSSEQMACSLSENPVFGLFRRAPRTSTEPGSQAADCNPAEAGATPAVDSTLCTECHQPAVKHAPSCWLGPRERRVDDEEPDGVVFTIQLWPPVILNPGSCP